MVIKKETKNNTEISISDAELLQALKENDNLTLSDVREQVVKHSLSKKSFSNLKIITRGMLVYARRKKWIDFSVDTFFEDLDIPSRCFTRVIKEDWEEVFNDEERVRLLNHLVAHPDRNNLGIFLIFCTGMRVGELVALKHSDIEDDCIRIRRTETFWKEEDGRRIYDVKEYPKSEAGVRTIVIPSGYEWVLNEIKAISPETEYVFCKNGKRITTNCIRQKLYRLCKKLDIYQKSPHKGRKTYGTILMDNGVDQCLVTAQMGHANISVSEKHYHRNRRTRDAKKNILSNIPEFSTNYSQNA